jgi:hypothetical protein
MAAAAGADALQARPAVFTMTVGTALLADAAATAQTAGADADTVDAGTVALWPALYALLAFLLAVGAANTEGQRKHQWESARKPVDDVTAGVTGR